MSEYKDFKLSLFKEILPLPPDPIFGLIKRFEADPKTNKVNLVPGVYYDQTLKQKKMRAICEAEKKLFSLGESNNYLPILGDNLFLQKSKELIFGSSEGPYSLKTYGAQTLGGTGALCIGGHFAAKTLSKTVYISSPTWPNHINIFKACGMDVFSYPYYCTKTNQLDFQKMISTLASAPEKSLIVLQPCGHNPTGCDLSREHWKELSELFMKNKLIPFFDLAYMGLAKGIEDDVWPLKYFASQGHEYLTAFSCSKSFGLYGQRTGALFINSKGDSPGVSSLLQTLIRSTYSNPPRYGAKLVTLILENKNLRKMWEQELLEMQKRIQVMREHLLSSLQVSLGSTAFDFLKNRFGMFSFLGLSKQHVDELARNFGVYLTEDGRINLAALNENNLQNVATSIVKIVQ